MGRQVESCPALGCEALRAALASFRWASSSDAMGAHTIEALAAVVSIRDNPRIVGLVPEAMNEYAISCRFMMLSRKRMFPPPLRARLPP